MERRFLSASTLVCLALAACGGGGANGGGTAPVAPPVTRTIGGSLTGIEGTLVLQNNGAANLTLNANGTFSFPSPIADGASYNVTVLSQPDYRQCSVTNGQGSATANVTNIAVSCVYADQRRWGTVVSNGWPTTRDGIDTGWTLKTGNGVLAFGVYRNFGVEPQFVNAWSGDFDPATRSWSVFTELTSPGNTVEVNLVSTAASGSQGDVLAFAQGGLLRVFTRANNGTWTAAAWSGVHRASDLKSVALADGTIYLVWRDHDPARTPAYLLNYRVLRQGVWSAPLTASVQVSNSGGFIVRSDGMRAMMSWQSSAPSILFCVLGDAGCEQSAELQPTIANLRLEAFHLSGDGSALAIWRGSTSFFAKIRSGGAWGAAIDLGAQSPNPASFMGAASLPDGFVVLGKAADVLVARTYRSSWSGWASLGPIQTSSWPDIAVDSSGNITTAWKLRTDSAPGAYPVLFNRFDAASAQWEVGGTLAEDSWQNGEIKSAVDSRGNVLVSWSGIAPPDNILNTSLYDATERVWRAPVVQGRNGFAERPYFDAQGRGVFTWIDYGTSEWKANTFARGP